MEDSFDTLERLLRGNSDEYEQARQLAGELRQSGYTYRSIGAAIKRALGVTIVEASVMHWIGGRNPRKMARATKFMRRPRRCYEIENEKVTRVADNLARMAKHTRKQQHEKMLELYEDWVRSGVAP